MTNSSNQRISLFIIIAVIIFILVFVVILASIGSNEKVVAKAAVYTKQTKTVKSKQLEITSYPHNRISDSFVFTIQSGTSVNESYIFGGPMQNSSVSVYRRILDSSGKSFPSGILDSSGIEESKILYTKVFSGNHGIVISPNLSLVNPSFYQIGKKINLESIKHTFIPINQEDEIIVCVNNIGYEDFKVFKCVFGDLESTVSYTPVQTEKAFKNLQPFGLSEYDIEKVCLEKIKEITSDDFILPKRIAPYRSFNKKDNDQRLWKFDSIGKYIVFYVKNVYSFDINDSYNEIHIQEKGTKDLNNGSLDYFVITDPRLTIYNHDENIPAKSFNDDMVKLMNIPVSFYEHFMYGKKREIVDIWNKIHNKVFIYKI
jgi:hypothetical protein